MPKNSQRRGGDFLSNLYLGSSEEKKQHLKDVFEIARGGGFDPYAVQRTLRGRPPVQEKKAYAQQVDVQDQLIHHIHPAY